MFTCPRNISVRSGDRRIHISSFIIFSARCQVGYNFKTQAVFGCCSVETGYSKEEGYKKKGGELLRA